MLSPAESGHEADWKEGDEWKREAIDEQIKAIKESEFDVEFSGDTTSLGLRFVGKKVIFAAPSSTAAKAGVKPGSLFVKIGDKLLTNSTSAINMTIRMTLKKSKPFNVTFRHPTARERAIEGGGSSSTSEKRGGSSYDGSSEVARLKAELKVVQAKLSTEKKLRDNEQQQTMIWKQLLNTQVAELEKAHKVAESQLKIMSEKAEESRQKFESAIKEKDSLKEQLLKTSGHLAEIKKELESERKQRDSISKENEQLEHKINKQAMQLKDVTLMFNNGQQLMLSAHKRIGELELKLKEAEESEMKTALQGKEMEITRLKRKIGSLSHLKGAGTGGLGEGGHHQSGSSRSSSKSPSHKRRGGTEDDLDFKALYDNIDTDIGIHGEVVLLTSHCTGMIEKSHQDRLRHLFAALGYIYQEVDGGMDKSLRKFLCGKSGINTYPQVFMRSGEGESTGYVFIGDFEKVFEMNELGRIHSVFKGCAMTESGQRAAAAKEKNKRDNKGPGKINGENDLNNGNSAYSMPSTFRFSLLDHL